MAVSRDEGANIVQARGYAQRFERGMIIHVMLPRVDAPTQWFVLFREGEHTQYWSFFVPRSLLGPEASDYRAESYAPPPGCHLPAPGFETIWAALKDLLGWALAPAENYEFPYRPADSIDTLAPPASLIAPDGARLLLHADRTWEVEMSGGISFAA